MNNKVKIGLICLLIIFLIGTIDYLVFYQFVFSFFYLLPILAGTYYLNQNFGFILAVISDVIWTLTDMKDNNDNTYYILVYSWNFLVRLSVFISLILILNRLKKALEDEQYYARIDHLTKIFNRRYFLELLNQEIKRSQRYELSLSFVYIDLDNFKFVNDNFGHKKGDEVLQTVVKTIIKEMREVDIIGRLGGDEFALFLPETNSEGAEKLCNRLQNQVLQAMELQSLPVSLSIGVVTFSKIPDTLDLMLEKADKLMYKVKINGKNNMEQLTIDNL